MFAKLAELVNQYLKKGSSAYIEGRLQTRSWDDRDGNKKQRTEIIANNVQFLDSRGSSSSSGGSGNAGSTSAAGQSAPPVDSYSQVEESLPGPASTAGAGPEDDLPF